MAKQATKDEIRSHLGDGLGNRQVKFKRDGSVEYYGSTRDTDRQHDYWHEGGHVSHYSVESDGTIRAR